MILGLALLFTFATLVSFITGVYYIWQVADTLTSTGFNAPDLAYYLGMYLKYLLFTITLGFISQILFAVNKV